ncbi:MAG: hypothetical protein NWR42_11765 [Desulfobacterales bacterium]|nr:hypothetical protein [Desulfobacterales bacterium]
MEATFRKSGTSFARDARLCRHVLDGTIEMPKLCLRQYDCARCAFDQWLDDTESEKGLQKRPARREFLCAAA